MSGNRTLFIMIIVWLLLLTIRVEVEARPDEMSIGDYRSSLNQPDQPKESDREFVEKMGITVEAEGVPINELSCNIGSVENDKGTSYFSDVKCLSAVRTMFPPGPGEIQYCRVAAMGDVTFGIIFNGPPGFVSKADPPFLPCD